MATVISHPNGLNPATDTPAKTKVLVISSGSFSGTTDSLIAALRSKGCDVVAENSTLRVLPLRPLYALSMLINALWLYGRSFRAYLDHTYAAYLARSKANDRIVSKHEHAEVVILVQATATAFWRRRRPGVLYTVFTDHTNRLSKQLPDFGLRFPEQSVHGSWNKIEQRILAQQDRIFVMGSHVKRSMVDDYQLDASRIHTVGAGPNLDVDIERDGITKDYQAKNVLFVGLDAPRKGLPTLKKAFSKIVREYPNAMLHIVGIPGTGDSHIKYYGELRGAPLKQLFYKCQVFAMPTLREPFGIVFIEAMYAKAVCIGTNIGAVPELIEDGKSGYLIEPNADAILAQKIIRLFSKPSNLREMAEYAYSRAKKKWRWDLAADSILRAVK